MIYCPQCNKLVQATKHYHHDSKGKIAKVETVCNKCKQIIKVDHYATVIDAEYSIATEEVAKIGAAAPNQPKETKDYMIHNLGDLFNAAYQEFGLNQSQVVRELGYSKKEEIPDAAGAWEQIKGIMRG